MYTRKLAPIVEESLGEFRILYLTGPRQAGKTTLVRQLAERLGMKYLTFDQQAVQQSSAQDPHGFIEAIGDKKIALDEFQYIPELIPAIKAASDQLTPNTFGKFLLRLPDWLKNSTKRQAVTLPKLHFVDTGLACHLLGLRTPERLKQSQFYGGLLENLLYLECRKHNGWANDEVRIYHYQDNRKNEVDLVLEQNNGEIIGLEVKASATIPKDFRGLNALSEQTGKRFRHGVLFYSGREILPFHQQNRLFYALPISLIGSQ